MTVRRGFGFRSHPSTAWLLAFGLSLVAGGSGCAPVSPPVASSWTGAGQIGGQPTPAEPAMAAPGSAEPFQLVAQPGVAGQGGPSPVYVDPPAYRARRPDFAGEPPLMVGLPQIQTNGLGRPVVRPNVLVQNQGQWVSPSPTSPLDPPTPIEIPPAMRGPGTGSTWPASLVQDAGAQGMSQPGPAMAPGGAELLPMPLPLEGPWAADGVFPDPGLSGGPIFETLLNDEQLCPCALPSYHPHTLLDRWFGVYPDPFRDQGLGYERVAHALFEMDTSQPFPNFRVRIESAAGWKYPDRAEYFWAKTGVRGPGRPETEVDYQALGLMFEAGGDKFSVQTNVPFIAVDPEQNTNSAGISDMSILTKLVMVDGENWQITQLFKTYILTGSAKRGTGNGHASIEPGFVFRYKASDRTYVHSEVKYWVPFGDPIHAGQFLRYGVGISTIYYDNDRFAILPTLEFVGWTVLDGWKTGSSFSDLTRADGDTILNIYPGVRFAMDDNGDLGVLEVGINGGVAVTGNAWYRGLLRLDVRFVY